jgi:hypothetical protein
MRDLYSRPQGQEERDTRFRQFLHHIFHQTGHSSVIHDTAPPRQQTGLTDEGDYGELPDSLASDHFQDVQMEVLLDALNPHICCGPEAEHYLAVQPPVTSSGIAHTSPAIGRVGSSCAVLADRIARMEDLHSSKAVCTQGAGPEHQSGGSFKRGLPDDFGWIQNATSAAAQDLEYCVWYPKSCDMQIQCFGLALMHEMLPHSRDLLQYPRPVSSNLLLQVQLLEKLSELAEPRMRGGAGMEPLNPFDMPWLEDGNIHWEDEGKEYHTDAHDEVNGEVESAVEDEEGESHKLAQQQLLHPVNEHPPPGPFLQEEPFPQDQPNNLQAQPGSGEGMHQPDLDLHAVDAAAPHIPAAANLPGHIPPNQQHHELPKCTLC